MAAVLVGTSESYIRIEASTENIVAGESFTVNVYVGAQVPVNAVNIHVKFPQSKVKVREIDTGRSVITIWTQPPKVSGDTVILQGGTFRKGFIGEHLIASLDMVANESGEAVFSLTDLSLLAGDGSGTNVPVKDATRSLVVKVSPTSEGKLDANLGVAIVTDLDGDGQVTLADIKRFMDSWGSTDSVYDFNKDNKVNFTDFAIILAQSFMR